MTATHATTLTFTQALELMVEMTTLILKRKRNEAEGKSLAQLGQYGGLFDMVSTEVQLGFYAKALRVTREYSEENGRTQLAEALGRALTDRFRTPDQLPVRADRDRPVAVRPPDTPPVRPPWSPLSLLHRSR